jgi:hypothetical protein
MAQLVIAGVFVGLSIIVGTKVRNYKLCTFLTFVLFIVLMLTGPTLYGRDWYYAGFDGGSAMGFFFGCALIHQLHVDDASQKRIHDE